jgi:hypothetical protein
LSRDLIACGKILGKILGKTADFAVAVADVGGQGK